MGKLTKVSFFLSRIGYIAEESNNLTNKSVTYVED